MTIIHYLAPREEFSKGMDERLGISMTTLGDSEAQPTQNTGPPLTRKSLTRFLAYVHASGGLSGSRGPQYRPTNTKFM